MHHALQKPLKAIGLLFMIWFAAGSAMHAVAMSRANAPLPEATAGTALVKDFSGTSPAPAHLVNINGTLFFSAKDATHGNELWKSDGTSAGTVLVKDIRVGENSSNPSDLTNVGGTLFFVAFDSANGYELWRSDGTEAGTTLVKDIYPGTRDAFPSAESGNELTVVGDLLFFAARDGVNGRELWVSDGTADGTALVKNIRSGSSDSTPAELTDVNGVLFFTADGGSGREVWKSDGTAGGTVMVKDINTTLGSVLARPTNLTNVNGTLFFVGSDGTTGQELWKSDGTEAGTTLVKELYPGTEGAFAGSGAQNWLVNVNGALFFAADDLTHGLELWKSDGSSAGTTLVKDIRPGDSGSTLTELTNINGTLMFVANDGQLGGELWRSDGTSAGTRVVKDLVAGPTSSNPYRLTSIGATLFFVGNEDIHGHELWKSDGTTSGTLLVKDIAPGGYYSDSSPNHLTNVDGTLFFVTQFAQLWRSDGSVTESRVFLPMLRR